MTTAIVSVGDAPRVKSGRDAAAYLQDWLTVIVPDAAERAECLRQFAATIWTNTAQVVERLEEYAAEIDPGANEPEPVEWDLSEVDGFERGTPMSLNETCAFFEGFDMEQEVARA